MLLKPNQVGAIKRSISYLLVVFWVLNSLSILRNIGGLCKVEGSLGSCIVTKPDQKSNQLCDTNVKTSDLPGSSNLEEVFLWTLRMEVFFFFWNFRFLVSPDFVLYTNTAKLLEIGAKITVWWFRRVRCPKQKKPLNLGSIRFEKYVQIARATFGFSTLVSQSFDLHLQSKDTDLDYEGNVQAKVFLRRVRWFLGRASFFRSNNIHSDRF